MSMTWPTAWRNSPRASNARRPVHDQRSRMPPLVDPGFVKAEGGLPNR